MRSYAHIAARFLGAPLLLDAGKARIIMTVVGPRLGVDGELVEEAGYTEPKDRRPYQITESGIALIDICGTLVNRCSGFDAMSGMSSYTTIANEVLMAVEDPLVRGILLRVDSFGGEVAGAFTCADAIMSARGSKPIWSAIDDNALSAGYLLGSSAEHVCISKTSGVGSVGVIAVHADQSGLDKKLGVKYEIIFSGKHKADGNPHAPLSNEVRARFQAQLDATRDLFVDHVAAARGMSTEDVYDTEADIYRGGAAVAMGFADEVLNVREAMAAFEAFLNGGAVSTAPATQRIAVDIQEAAMHKKPEVIETPAPVLAPVAEATPAQASAAEKKTETSLTPKADEDAETVIPDEDEGEETIDDKKPKATPIAAAVTFDAPAMAAAVTAARTEGFAQAMSVVEICQVAKRPDLAYALLCRNASVEDARRLVQQDMVAESDRGVIQSRVNAAASAAGGAMARIDAAAKEIAEKEHISIHAAMAKALKLNPDLYAQYCAEQDSAR